jgi:P27 family predicted phage terminase small subunit
MKGKKPIPKKLHLLRGNPSKKKFSENEPEPATGIPEKPDFLCAAAIEEWDYISGKLATLGLLSEIDRAALAAYCQIYGRWSQVESILAADNGLPDKSAMSLMRIAAALMQQLRLYLAEFGMSPSSRCRVAVTKQENLQNSYEKWKNRPEGK